MPTPALREVAVPPEVPALQAQLAMDEVLGEMAIPGGLKLDAPVFDPLSQYKADLRAELAQHPQTTETMLAGEAVMIEEFIVPPAETAPPPPPPEPEPPVLTVLEPVEGPQAGGTTVALIGGPFTEQSVVLWDGAEIARTFVTDARLEVVSPAAPLVGDPAVPATSAEVKVTQDADETAAQTFTYTEEVVPEAAPPPEGQSGTPIVEGA